MGVTLSGIIEKTTSDELISTFNTGSSDESLSHPQIIRPIKQTTICDKHFIAPK